jgi:hypothetical protein
MMTREQFDALSPAQREQAWRGELAAMIAAAMERWRESLSAGAGTRVHAGSFTVVVTDKGGAS